MATPRRPLEKEKFLMWMLAGIFAFQGALFAFGAIRCSNVIATDKVVTDVCPELGRRYDQTFGVMIATVLALLGTSRSNGPS